MSKLEVSKEIRDLIQETCEAYKKEFRKHRKEVTHFSQNGNYKERESYRFEYRY